MLIKYYKVQQNNQFKMYMDNNKSTMAHRKTRFNNISGLFRLNPNTIRITVYTFMQGRFLESVTMQWKDFCNSQPCMNTVKRKYSITNRAHKSRDTICHKTFSLYLSNQLNRRLSCLKRSHDILLKFKQSYRWFIRASQVIHVWTV